MQSLWMILASFSFAVMGVCVKLASATFSAPEIVFYRAAISLLCYFYAISLLPLATAVTLSYTSPLFLALFLAWFGGKPLRGTVVGALVLGLVGVVLLLRPSFHADQLVGGLFGLTTGILAGLAYYNVR